MISAVVACLRHDCHQSVLIRCSELVAGAGIEHKTDDVAMAAERVHIVSEREEAHPEQDKVSSAMDEETAKDIMTAPGVLICLMLGMRPLPRQSDCPPPDPLRFPPSISGVCWQASGYGQQCSAFVS